MKIKKKNKKKNKFAEIIAPKITPLIPSPTRMFYLFYYPYFSGDFYLVIHQIPAVTFMKTISTVIRTISKIICVFFTINQRLNRIIILTTHIRLFLLPYMIGWFQYFCSYLTKIIVYNLLTMQVIQWVKPRLQVVCPKILAITEIKQPMSSI